MVKFPKNLLVVLIKMQIFEIKMLSDVNFFLITININPIQSVYLFSLKMYMFHWHSEWHHNACNWPQFNWVKGFNNTMKLVCVFWRHSTSEMCTATLRKNCSRRIYPTLKLSSVLRFFMSRTRLSIYIIFAMSYANQFVAEDEIKSIVCCATELEQQTSAFRLMRG